MEHALVHEGEGSRGDERLGDGCETKHVVLAEHAARLPVGEACGTAVHDLAVVSDENDGTDDRVIGERAVDDAVQSDREPVRPPRSTPSLAHRTVRGHCRPRCRVVLAHVPDDAEALHERPRVEPGAPPVSEDGLSRALSGGGAFPLDQSRQADLPVLRRLFEDEVLNEAALSAKHGVGFLDPCGELGERVSRDVERVEPEDVCVGVHGGAECRRRGLCLAGGGCEGNRREGNRREGDGPRSGRQVPRGTGAVHRRAVEGMA